MESSWSVEEPLRPLWTGSSTLGQVLEHLGIRVLDLLAAPKGLDEPAGETVVAGAGEPLPDRPRGVLLAVGSGVDPATTRQQIEEAGAAGYAAVVIKTYGAPVADCPQQRAGPGSCCCPRRTTCPGVIWMPYWRRPVRRSAQPQTGTHPLE